MPTRSLTTPCRRAATSLARFAGRISLAAACVATAATHAFAATDIVLYTSDVTTVSGNWSQAQSASGAGSMKMQSNDYGWSQLDSPLSSPNDYFEATFTAPSYVKYHVWLRLRATNDSKYNDSVWVQFSDALDSNLSSIYSIGSTSGLLVNLENCSGCGVSGWGWQDKAYWLSQTNVVQFPSSGTHRIRIQTREDGAQIDQIVLSPATYLGSAPGSVSNDSTILPESSTSTASVSVSASSGGLSPYNGSPAPVPGTISAENFDGGGQGVAYWDSSSGNSGGAYRSTDVDIEQSSAGGYDIGWTSPGEWLNYTVNVTSSGTYTMQVQVASPGGSSFHVGFNGGSTMWTQVSVPATGGWQNWTTVSLPVTVSSGTQQMTIMFDSGGMNLGKMTIGGSSSSPSPSVSSGSGPYSGSPAAVPGHIKGETFDNGGEGVGYHDTTPGNNGGAFRSTDVDIEQSSDGGYDVGWTAPGEWLNYTVNVASAGSYTVSLNVASMWGGTMHVGFNNSSNAWASVNVPATGGWQNWTTVSVPVTLGSGTQQMTIYFDTGGTNFNFADVASGGSSSNPPPSGGGGGGGSASGAQLSVADWNVQVDDSSSGHAQTVMDYLAGFSPVPQVIVIEEAHASQYNTYISELQNRTGQTWNGAFQGHCAPGAWNGSYCTQVEDEGVAVFSSLPVQGSEGRIMPYADQYHSGRAAVRLSVSLNGTTVQVFGLHLQVGNAGARYNSMAMIKSWASNYGSPQIVAGDFNADVDQIDTSSGMYPNFVDTWQVVGSGSGFTASVPSPTMKLDYWFTDQSQRLQPQWSQVVTWTGSASDHYPLQTVFTLRY